MHAYLINILANIIISRYFHEFSCVVLIKDAQDDVIKTPEDIARIIFDAENQSTCELLKPRCQGFIIDSIKAPAILSDLEQKLVECSIGGFTERKYLILNYSLNQELSSLPIMEYVKDILVIRPRAGNFHLFTHTFVENTQWILLDVWQSGSQQFIYDANLYPEKISDLKGKTIKLSTFSYFPYSMVGETFAQSNGIEMVLMQEFLGQHNGKASLTTRENEEWGDAFVNATGYGVIGDIVTRQSDIGFAAVFMWPNIYRLSDFTASTLQIRVKCLVPKSKVEYNWLSVWVYFSFELWVLLTVVLLLSSIVATLKTTVEKYGSFAPSTSPCFPPFFRPISAGGTCKNLGCECGLFQACGIMVSQPKSNKHKSAMFLLLNLFSVVMGALYGSGTASRMAIPKNVDEINTVVEMAEKNLQWGTTQKLWLASIIQDERKEYRKIIENFVERNKTELTKLGRTANFGFPVDQLPSGSIALQNYLDEPILEHLRLMKDNIYTEHVVFLTRKNYVLLPALNDFILRVQQSGLIQNWEGRATASKSSHLQYVVKYSRESNKNVVLKWAHVKGVFATWFISAVVSILAFGFELNSKKITEYLRVTQNKMSVK